MKTRFIVPLFALLSLTAFAQKSPDLALTPPMGWNSWNTFGTDINEQLVMEIADAFAALNDGRLTAPRPAAGLSLDEIGLMMGGAHGLDAPTQEVRA